MPLKFWKKEKAAKGKEKPPADEKKPEPKGKPAEAKAKVSAPEAMKGEVKKADEQPAARPPTPEEVTEIVDRAHAALVELGLTVPLTKGVFVKRVAMYPGGEAAFVADYRAAPHRAVTRVLADWLGIRVPEVFEPDALLAEVNLRLSSFKLNVQAKDLSWLDQELNLRKARIIMGEQDRVVRFKDARDLLKGVNELLTARKVMFLELETWADDFAFILVREPRWDQIATAETVVVKADQTAKGGECGECGAPVGKYWSDCLKCGAVFG